MNTNKKLNDIEEKIKQLKAQKQTLIQKEKEKSIQEVNHASTELADIMASMKGEMK